MEKTRITIVAVTCIALFFLTNYLFRYLIGFTGLLASLVIAALIAVYMSFSIARTLERLPMPEERSRALWIYGGFLGALFVALGPGCSLMPAWMQSPSPRCLFTICPIRHLLMPCYQTRPSDCS